MNRYASGTLDAERETLRAVDCLIAAGDVEEALALVVAPAQRGSVLALATAAEVRLKTKGVDEAIAWLDRLIDSGEQSALGIVGGILSRTDRSGEIQAYLERAGQLEKGRVHEYELTRNVETLRKHGQIDDALEQYQRAADAACRLGGSSRSIIHDAVGMLSTEGRLDQALDWLVARAEAGDSSAGIAVSELLRKQGQIDEAFVWLARLADAGSVDAIREAAWLLWKAGRVEDAVAWIEARSKDVGAYALWEMAEMLGEAGRLDRAMALCERAANGGGGFHLSTLVKLLAASGRIAEARRLHLFGREPDGRVSGPWSATDCEIREDDFADVRIPATEPEPFRVTPRPSDLVEAFSRRPPPPAPSA
jgi:tetratricopeptide (TPR) repeat protein